MYNGTIDVQSQVGLGTTVTVKLPLAKAASGLSSLTPDDTPPKDQVEEVKKLLNQFKYSTYSTHGFQSGSFVYLKKSLHTYLTQWFDMNHDIEDRVADIALVTEERLDAFLSELAINGASKPSLIIVVRYVPSHTYTSQQNSAIGIPIETLTIPFGPWKLLKTLLACLSPKQASPITSPIPEHKYFYTSALASPTLDLHKELDISSTKPAIDEVTPTKSLSVPQNSLKLSQPTILCVDDNPINLRLLKAYFRKLNFDITCAENGAVAFSKYRLQPNGFDLVFMGTYIFRCSCHLIFRVRLRSRVFQSLPFLYNFRLY